LDKKPLESFEAMEPILKRKISKDSRLEINKAFLITKLKKENKFIQSSKAMKLVTSKADSTWLKSNWTYNKADTDLNQVLFTINKEKFLLKNFYEYMEANPATAEAKKAKPIYYAQQKYQDYINKAVYDYQNAHLAEKVPEYRYLMNEYRDGTLMFKVMEQNVWTKALTDTAGLHKFFDEHRKNYQWKERSEATIYVCDSEKTLNLLKEELQKDYFENDVAKFDETKFATNSITIDSVQQDNLNKLVDFLQNDTISLVEIQGFVVKNEKNEFATKRMQAVKQFLIAKGIAVNRIAEKNLGKMTAKKGGVKYAIYSKSNKALVAKMSKTNPLAVQLTEGVIQRGDNMILDQTPWTKGNFTINKDNRFAYVIIKNVIPITDKKLSETKGAAVTDYQNYLETTWLDSLRKKYKVVINEEAFKKMIGK
jgi:peptidyl-prolyl cis-trans isomerase SurA